VVKDAKDGQEYTEAKINGFPEAASGSLAGSTYTIVGSTSGYYHGWQYYGGMVVTARLATFSSGAGSAIGGMDSSDLYSSSPVMKTMRCPSSTPGVALNSAQGCAAVAGSNPMS